MIMEEYLPVMAQLMVQFSLAGLYLMTKVAFTEGMSPLVLVAYRTITATLVLAPLAYFIEKDKRPPLNLRTAGGIFILACLGMAINQNCYFTALYYTSSTFVSTIANLIPAITFVVALLLRLERLDVRGIRGRAKVLGTLTCVGGAMIVTLVKGPSIVILRGLKANFLLVSLMDAIHPSSPQSNWTLGPIFILASVLAWSAWLNYQAWAFKNYPAQLTLTALMCFMAIIPTAGIAFIFEEQSAWTLKWDVRLLTYIYSGVLCTAFQFFIQSWCIKKKGPVFAAAFFPVCTVIVSVLEPIIFHVDVHVGRQVLLLLDSLKGGEDGCMGLSPDPYGSSIWTRRVGSRCISTIRNRHGLGTEPNGPSGSGYSYRYGVLWTLRLWVRVNRVHFHLVLLESRDPTRCHP